MIQLLKQAIKILIIAMPKVIIPSTVVPLPKPHEVSAARILADYFRQDVVFIARAPYPTPDLTIGTIDWELKSPTGRGRQTIEHAVRDALRKSENIVFDCRRIKIDHYTVERKLQTLFTRIRKIKRILIITKSGGVIELTR